MNRRYVLPLVLVVIASLSLLVGCSKDDDNPASGNKSRKELLLLKTWELKTATSMGVDVKTIIESYMKKIKFSSDGTAQIEGSEGSFESTWALASNDTQIVFDQGTSDEFVVTIVSLSESEFKGKANIEYQTVTYPVDLTYK